MSNDDLPKLFELFDQLVDLNSEQRQAKLDELRASGNPHVAQLETLLGFHSEQADLADDLLSQLSERLPLQQWLQVSPYSTSSLRQPADLRELVGLFRWDAKSRQFYAGDYRIGKCLAINSHTATYSAEDSLLGRRAVITFAFPRYLQETHRKEQFLQSAKLVSEIAHPNVATLLGVIQQEELLGIARQWIPGHDLAHWIEAHRPLSAPSVALLLQRITEGVAALHRHSALHGDLKPANIIMREDQILPVITDFGTVVSAVSTDSSSRIWLGGTPGYIAPEVLQQGQLDKRGELYSLGKILSELLEATEKESAVELRLALEQVREELVAEDPQQRPATANQLLERLVGLTGVPLAEQESNSSKDRRLVDLVLAKRWTRRSILGLSATVVPFYMGSYWHQQQLQKERPQRSFIPGQPEDIRSQIRLPLIQEDLMWSANRTGHPFKIEGHDATVELPDGGLFYLRPGARRGIIESERFRLPARAIRWNTLLIWTYFNSKPGAAELRVDVRAFAAKTTQPLHGWRLCVRRQNYFGGAVRRNLIGTVDRTLLQPHNELQFRFTLEVKEAWSGQGQPPLLLVVEKADESVSYLGSLHLWYEEKR